MLADSRARSIPVDVIVSIIHQCDIVDLVRWRRTSRAFFTVVSTVLRKRFNAAVWPFVGDPILFNALMTKYEAIISGSVALQFFLEDETWKPGDLDIYVPDTTFADFTAAVEDPNGLNFTRCPRQGEASHPDGEGGIREIGRAHV